MDLPSSWLTASIQLPALGPHVKEPTKKETGGKGHFPLPQGCAFRTHSQTIPFESSRLGKGS